MSQKTLNELKNLWNEEKESYRTVEVGSGVQKFVKEIFKCPQIFDLAEGRLSTNDLKRKKEFTEETQKKTRRADIVIFIDSDVIIPVEVEKHGNIRAGEKQVFQYQADWIKKYGLLTDGKEWRFYNNRFIEGTFKIDAILNNPQEFLTFWGEYTKPDHYYRSFFEKKGQLELWEPPSPQLDEVREDFFIDITKLIDNLKNKLNLKGYFKQEKDETQKDKETVEITYAYLIQFILYKTLVDNAFADFEQDWIERLKSIDHAIRNETYDSILIKIKGISDKISDRIYKRFNDEQLMINKKLEEILKQPKQDIGDVSVWLDIMLFINRYNFANVQNEIFGYVYENYLKDRYLNEKKGQYFTDPYVVEFMLNEMGYGAENLKKRYAKDKDSISIIDPACGSGTFLYNATARLIDGFFDGSQKYAKETEEIINANVYGLDIAEFPLYLAEMSILMRMLPIVINERYNNPVDQKIKVFKTRDSITEFLDTELRNTISDINVDPQLNLKFPLDLGYDSFMRDKKDLDNLKESLEERNRKPRYRFDYVVGNPPYVSYNESASQHLLFFDMMKNKDKNVKLSDVYGINLHSVEGNTKKYPPKPNLYAFFIALGLALLKDNGKLCFIIPQTLITETDYDVLRFHLAKYTTIEKIFIFENPLFLGRGIKQKYTVATSSLIFVISKTPPTDVHKVQIFSYDKQEEDISHMLNSIKKPKLSNISNIKQDLLLKNYLNWIIIKLDENFIELYDEYKYNSQPISIYSEHQIARDRFKSEFFFDVGFILDKSEYLSSPKSGNEYEIIELNNFAGYSKYYPKEFYPNDKRKIELPKNSQGHGTLTKKYKIIWSKVYSNRFYFTDRNVLPSMSYTQFISSDNKKEMLYLFSLLNSKLNNFIFNKLFRLGNEKYGIFVVVKRIKQFLKVPFISEENESIKSEIISQTEAMLSMEDRTLSDLVDFKGVMMQKFDKMEVQGNNFILFYKDKQVKCKIKKDPETIKKAIKQQGIFNEEHIGSILTLKEISVFDKDYQAQIKDYIDDLVFALYFKLKLPKLGFGNHETIKKTCTQNKCYKFVNF